MVRKFGLSLLGIAAFTLALTGCLTVGPGGLGASRVGRPWSSVSVRAEKPELIVSTPHPGQALGGRSSPTWGHATHPTLIRLSKTRFVAYYGTIGDVGASGIGKATTDWPSWTDDGGLTWHSATDPYLWLDGAPDHLRFAKAGQTIRLHAGYSAGNISLPNGVSLAYFSEPKRISGSSSSGYSELSTQGIWTRDGSGVHGPENIMFYAPLVIPIMYLNPHGQALPDGSLLLTAYYHGKRTVSGSYNLILFRSTDGGRTFIYFSTIGTPDDAPWGTEGPCEAGLVVLPNGELLCVARTGDGGWAREDTGGMLLARSSDGGKTWEHSDLGVKGVWPQLLRLENGLIVLGYGRPGNHLLFSEDDGRTWKKRVQLNRNNENTTGYLDMAEVAPNRLMVIYDLMAIDYQNQRITGVFREFIDVKRAE